jgi:hypothetical protein
MKKSTKRKAHCTSFFLATDHDFTCNMEHIQNVINVIKQDHIHSQGYHCFRPHESFLILLCFAKSHYKQKMIQTNQISETVKVPLIHGERPTKLFGLEITPNKINIILLPGFIFFFFHLSHLSHLGFCGCKS